MANLFRWLTAMFFVLALVALLTLLVSDTWNALTFTSVHRRAGALSFVLIGASYVTLQLSSSRPWKEKVKQTLLGMAFVLWGSVQLLPANAWTTAMDTFVVLFFVADLSWMIVAHLKENSHE